MASEFLKTMTSFGGADLNVAFGNKVIGELQSISWAVQRKKAPVYTLGSSDPRSFSRGVRGIAGSLVFAVFDRDSLIEELGKVWSSIAPRAMFTAAANLLTRNTEDFSKALDLAAWDNTNSLPTGAGAGLATGSGTTAVAAQPGQLATNGENIKINVPAGFGVIRAENIMYADMLPPFDVTMTFANEYGQAAFQKIYDIDILNEGSGVSVDSIVMERQMTFIARRISPIMKGVYQRETGGGITQLPVDTNTAFA
jgi:hypothetical protein